MKFFTKMHSGIYPGRAFTKRGRGKTRGRTRKWENEKGEEKNALEYCDSPCLSSAN